MAVVIVRMMDSEDARKYLEAALPMGQWRAASYAIGRDHAYIQQYIRHGKPRWLSEADRNALVERYGLDADMLRPPLRLARVEHAGLQSHQQPRLDAETRRRIENEPCLLQIVLSWPWIVDDADKRRATNIVLAFANKGRAARAVSGQRLDATPTDNLPSNEGRISSIK